MSTKRERSKPKSSRYPTDWSHWSWNDKYNCDVRCRQVAPGNAADAWEYGYRNVAPTGYTPRSIEADPPPFNTIQEPSPASYVSTNFRYDAQSQGVSSITQDLASNSLTAVQSKGPEMGFSSSTPTSAYASSVADPGSFFGRGPRNNPSFGGTRKIRTENPKSKVDLDPNFKVHHSDKFKFGKVFKILWSEPEGSCGTELSQTHHSLPAKYNQKTFQKIRRFLVVDSKRGHSICLPILTYGGRGATKAGAHPEDHALIYTGHEPALQPGEILSKRPIRVNPIDGREALSPASRLNFAKHYTVEHNVKVFFVGQVSREHEQRVVAAYNSTNRPLPDRQHYSFNRGDMDASVSHTQGPDPTFSEDSSSAAPYWTEKNLQSLVSQERPIGSTASAWDTSAGHFESTGAYGMQATQPETSSWTPLAGQPLPPYTVNTTPSYGSSSVSTSSLSVPAISKSYSADQTGSSYGTQPGFYASNSSQALRDSSYYDHR